MKLYLINKNPIISKLVALSVAKLGVEMEESQAINLNKGAEIVLIDDECFEQELFDSYKTENPEAKFGLFYAKSTERLEGFNEYIQKPFLPTDLVKTLSKISGITPIDNQHVDKQSEEEALDLGGESLDSLDEELDLSGFDDLQLDDEDSSAGDEQLDFGAEEGIEEATEDSNVALDFGAEEGTQEGGAESGDEQLDFGAEDSQEEDSQDLNVLDKGDVEEIKDLLSSDEDVPKEDELLDLSKELETSSDSSASDDLDFGDLSAELDQMETAEASEKELDSKDSQLENLEVEDEIKTHSADFAETGEGEDFDFGDLDIDAIGKQESEDSLEIPEAPLAQDSQSDMDLDNLTSEAEFGEVNLEDGLGEAQDLGESDLDSSASEPSSEELGAELGESTEELKDMDFGELDLPNENLEASEVVDTANGDLDSLGDLEETTEANDLSLEAEGEQAAFDVDLESQAQKLESDSESLEGLESGEDLESNLEMLEGLDEKSEENETLEPSSQASQSGLDDFDSLSAEGMSEALGEPIAKAPSPTPLVPNPEIPSDSSLPSSIQANSLESLISALQNLQAQNLKDLLSGATISINIQFPKKD